MLHGSVSAARFSVKKIQEVLAVALEGEEQSARTHAEVRVVVMVVLVWYAALLFADLTRKLDPRIYAHCVYVASSLHCMQNIFEALFANFC